MSDTVIRDGDTIARDVFAGLTPAISTVAASDRDRIARALSMRTVPIVLVGSMAAMTMNLTGQVAPVQAKEPTGERSASAFGKTLRTAVAAAGSALRSTTSTLGRTTVAPPTYTVQAGDTVSDIAVRYGLATASVLALNGLSWSSLIFPGQVLTLTNGSPLPAPKAAEDAHPGRYTIVPGDTISAIAERFGVSTLSVLTANGLGWSSIIYPGQTLAIPGVTDPLTVEAPSEAIDVPQHVDEPASLPATPEAPPAVPAPPVVAYTVAAGDTISGIAERHGISTQALLDANGLSWDSLIFSGDVLTLPGVGAAIPGSGSGTSTSSVTGLTDEMRSNAAVIVQIGRELGVSDYGIVIALATAMQESTLRNLDWGDRDSVGLFQQRPSSGWGSVEQLTTPAHAARLFYGGPSNPNAGATRGLLDISGWESMPLTVAAQAVQISAFPDAYAKWEASAWSWLTELG